MANKKNFFDDVYAVVEQIPHGRVCSYGVIGAFLGAKRSARMVGWAMNAAHTLPHIPAHRVVNSTGHLTGRAFFGPNNEMQSLLEAEGIQVKNHKILDFSKVFWDPAVELI